MDENEIQEKYCDEIDCAWCADINCPHDNKMTLVNLDALSKLAEKTDEKNEKEFNKLQKKLDAAIQNLGVVSQQYNKVIQQNKSLQEELNKSNEEYDKIFKLLAKQRFKKNKYKQALEKIREIAKSACDTSVCHYDCKNCSDGKIIDKINEVLQ